MGSNQGFTKTSLKFVVADDDDLRWAQKISNHFPDLPVFVQPCLSKEEQALAGQALVEVMQTAYNTLANKVYCLNWPGVRVLPQLHTLLWGNKRAV